MQQSLWRRWRRRSGTLHPRRAAGFTTGTRDGLLVRVQFSQDESGAWNTSDVAWVPSYQDLDSPYRWCALATNTVCNSAAEDAAGLARTTATVNRWGADDDGAHRL